MPRINLLPWREEQRKQRQKAFLSLLGAASIAGVLLVLVLSWLQSGRVDHQRQRNAYLRAEITRLNQEIQKIEALEETRESLLSRKQVIEDLQQNRTLMVHLFDQLVRTIPSGVRLTSARQQGQQLTLMGLTQSNARVSAYMRNLQASEWLHDPTLRIIEADEGENVRPDQRYRFTLDVTLRPPESEEDQAAAEGAAEESAP
ncbi:MAG: PilN domain-containing protein [Wenzhouxiangellaceae bacterium]